MNNTLQNKCSNDEQKATAPAPLVFRIFAEFIASVFAIFTIYTFSSVVTAMYGVNVLLIAAGTGLAYAAAISIAAKVSGGHVNPAVTIASMLTGRTSYISGILYIIAQVLGALVAASITVFILPQTKMVPEKTWFAPVVNGFESASISANQLKSVNASFGVISALIVEIIAVLIIVATAMTYTREDGSAKCTYAAHMGIAYSVGAFITYQITGSGLNPARSTGIAILAQSKKLATAPLSQLWVFWIAPVFAAALVGFVMLISKLVRSSSKDSNSVKESNNAGDLSSDDSSKNTSVSSEESENSENKEVNPFYNEDK
ncbi:membrane channel protein [Gardnerella pickettii 00703Bmash]|uniref:MIP/aquaporin family protein n=1 Tax=Gardnerella pickettii TaxID=2914924 RepID=UPI000263448A|nr:aquaporin [Gardnerella pickettii]EIK83939.1 membrane channel protein [Gardnerella pickettii 00703Bmash]